MCITRRVVIKEHLLCAWLMLDLGVKELTESQQLYSGHPHFIDEETEARQG